MCYFHRKVETIISQYGYLAYFKTFALLVNVGLNRMNDLRMAKTPFSGKLLNSLKTYIRLDWYTLPWILSLICISRMKTYKHEDISILISYNIDLIWKNIIWFSFICYDYIFVLLLKIASLRKVRNAFNSFGISCISINTQWSDIHRQ